MSDTPKPGHAVRGSTTGRPIMAAMDLLGKRWVLRVIWELREGPLSFRALQEACDNPSPTVLNARLKDLRAAKLVAHDGESGYVLTPDGTALIEALSPLNSWSEGWAKSLQKEGE